MEIDDDYISDDDFSVDVFRLTSSFVLVVETSDGNHGAKKSDSAVEGDHEDGEVELERRHFGTFFRVQNTFQADSDQKIEEEDLKREYSNKGNMKRRYHSSLTKSLSIISLDLQNSPLQKHSAIERAIPNAFSNV